MSELSTRADSKELPPFEPKGSPKPIELLVAEAERAVWRIVELFGGGPFDVRLAWSAGSGAGASARITVARSARVSLFARSVNIVALIQDDQPVLAAREIRHRLTVGIVELQQRGVFEQ